MDEERLKKIEARAAVATPGPWYVGGDSVAGGDDGDEIYWYTLNARGQEHEIATLRDNYGLHDAEFVAHARVDVPALVAEVRRLQALLRREPEAWRRLIEEGA